MKLDAVFSTQRLITHPYNSCSHYQLQSSGELRFAALAPVPIMVDITSMETGDRQTSHIKLSAAAGTLLLEEAHELPAAKGDCWTFFEQLRAGIADQSLHDVLALFVARICEATGSPTFAISMPVGEQVVA